MLEERIGDAEVTLGIFEIDWIHLMRHDRRTGLAFDGALAEVSDRNVTPHVAAETEQNGIDARDRREHLRDEVVTLDLRRERIEDEPESFDELLRQRDPINLGIRERMRIEIADRAVELAQILLRAQQFQLPLDARGENRHLLADCGG